MAFCAQLVHDVLLFYFSLSLELLDAAGFLLESCMTDLAIDKFFLVHVMGEKNIASFSALQHDFFGPFVLLTIG